MFFKELIAKGRYSFHEGFTNWQDAIKASCEPLLKDKTIEPSYVNDIISKVNELGAYIVIAPNICIPHAQEGVGVNDTAICFMKTEKPVKFSDDVEQDASLFFVLASTDNDKHMQNLMGLSEMLSDDSIVEKLLNAKNADDLKKIAEEL